MQLLLFRAAFWSNLTEFKVSERCKKRTEKTHEISMLFREKNLKILISVMVCSIKYYEAVYNVGISFVAIRPLLEIL